MKYMKTLITTSFVSASVMGAAFAESKFNEYLTEDYNSLSALEVHTADLDDTRHLKNRAVKVASGQTVTPMELNRATLSSSDYNALTEARNDLNRVLDAGARNEIPRLAARAQSSFDCMVIHSEEQMRNHNLANCTEEFVSAMKELNAIYPERIVKMQYGATLPTQKRPVVQPTTERVSFALDSYTLDAADKRVLDGVARDMRNTNERQIKVLGFADTTGTEAYNKWISEKRADSVVSYLSGQLDGDITFDTTALGENNLPVETRDGVANPKNRIVKITY